MQQAMTNQQQVLGDQLGDISMGLRSQDYDRQVGLRENDINRRLHSGQADMARNAGLAESSRDRYLQGWAANQGFMQNAASLIPQFNDMRYDDARSLMNIGQQQKNPSPSAFDTRYSHFHQPDGKA